MNALQRYQAKVEKMKKGTGIRRYNQPKRNAYKISQNGQYGGLVIDLPKLYGHLKVVAHKNGQKVYDKQGDFDTLDLLTKRFNGRKNYSELARSIFNDLNRLSEIPIHRTSKKYSKLGSGVVYYNNPQDLLSRLELLGGSMSAGNNSNDVREEFVNIAHLLNKLNVINNKQVNDLMKNYLIYLYMSEILLRIASKNRVKSGVSLSHDFTIKYNDPIKLSYDMKHELAVRMIKMTYSWYNIRQSYRNNQIKYSHDKGVSWETITFVDGMYSYDDIDEYIKKYMRDKKHILNTDTNEKDDSKIEYGINMYFILSTYRVLVELHEDYRLDLTNLDFRKLIGFDSKIIVKTEYGTNLPDITRGVDEIYINCDKVTDSIVDGESSNTLTVIPVVDLVRSLPFSDKPLHLAYSPVSGHLISSMRFYVTDSTGNPIDLNGIDWYIEVFLRSTEI